MITKQCKTIKSDGNRCQAYRITKSAFCYFHSPKMKTKRIEAQKKGGRNRRKNRDVNLITYPIRTQNDIQNLLEKIINNLITGDITPSIARVLAILCNQASDIQSTAKSERSDVKWVKEL